MCVNRDTGLQKSNIFQPSSQQHTYYVTNDGATGNEADTDDEIYAIYTMSHKRIKPLRVMPKLNGVPLNMEIDTGASLSIINLEVFENLKKRDGTIKRFCTYGGEILKSEGVINVLVEYTGQSIRQPLYVVHGKSPCLMGRDLLSSIRLNWAEIFSADVCMVSGNWDKLLKEYREIFETDQGTMKDSKAHIYLKRISRYI